MDIKQAYRNIPVHPTDRYLLGMKLEERTFVDTTLPFGLRSAPMIFSAVADALAWMMQQRGVSWLAHYVDDFITVGAPGTSQTQISCTEFAGRWPCWSSRKRIRACLDHILSGVGIRLHSNGGSPAPRKT